MIPISQIDPELSIYKEHQVVIWGAGARGKTILSLFQDFNIVPVFFCDNDAKKWGTDYLGVPVISPQELVEKYNLQQEKILVQTALLPAYEVAVQEQLKSSGITPVICYEECFQMLQYYIKCERVKETPELFALERITPNMTNAISGQNVQKHTILNWDDLGIFVCMYGKTGDNTLFKTFDQHSIPFVGSHFPKYFNQDYFPGKTVRIVTAIREPISRTISGMYQGLSNLSQTSATIFEDFLPKKSNDAQDYLTSLASQTSYKKRYNMFHQQPYESEAPLTQAILWFDSFKEHIVDLLAHPFDQEAGYSIIKEGRYDIFVYQLERLNDIIPQLSEWVGVPFDKLENANEASSKWIANSYKQAQKELKFSQEYFDLCYNDPYIQHFYSQEDIAKFKEKWRKNIDPNK